MDDEGYTLAETLAALAILGLAIGGLGSVVHVLIRQELAGNMSLGATAEVRRANALLFRLVERRGPFSNQGPVDFNGDESGFSFGCEGGAQTCGALISDSPSGRELIVSAEGRGEETVRLPSTGAVFRYLGSDGPTPNWPQPVKSPQSLLAIALVNPELGAPLSVTKIWIDERRDCSFDTIAGDCRRPSS